MFQHNLELGRLHAHHVSHCCLRAVAFSFSLRGSLPRGAVRSVLHGERGIDIKPSHGRGGYMQDVLFDNIVGNGVGMSMGSDGSPLMPGNHYTPLIANLQFVRVPSAATNPFSACKDANRSKCFNLTVDGKATKWPELLPPQTFACKKTAKTMFGVVQLPWGVCLPLDAPVNMDSSYPNWGPATGNYASLADCQAACEL
jgi:hypothetical protein